MLDKPSVTLPTAKSMSAAATERERRIAATIEKQQGLLAARQSLANRLRKSRSEPATLVRTLRAHIDRIGTRQEPPPGASAQSQMLVAPGLGVDARFRSKALPRTAQESRLRSAP